MDALERSRLDRLVVSCPGEDRVASKQHEERGEECAERRKVEEPSHREHRALAEPKRQQSAPVEQGYRKREGEGGKGLLVLLVLTLGRGASRPHHRQSRSTRGWPGTLSTRQATSRET